MRVLVTGGAGFIGSHLGDRLVADGHEVVCIDNLITGSLSNVAHLQSNTKFRFIQHDVSKPLEIDESLDYVLHFASPASPVDYLKFPIQTLKVGSLGTLNALGIAKAKHAKFLLASTSEVYGDPEVHPQPESYWGHVNPVGPRGVYDESKRFAEALTMAYHHEHGIDTRIVRIFNTFGPRMRTNDGRAIPNFISQALKGEPVTVYGDGSQTRSFCYIEDLVEGLMRVMGTDCHEPINLGNPNEWTILELANTILRLVNGTTSRLEQRRLPVDDPKQRRPDIGRVTELTGWMPRVDVVEGLTQTIAWFRQTLTEVHP